MTAGAAGLDVDLRKPRRPARLVAIARDDGEQSLAVEQDLIESANRRLIGEDRRDVVLAWNIRRSQNNDDARGAADRL